MPAGVNWKQYLRFSAAALFSMFAGAQIVHMIYKPMDDFEDYLKEAVAKEEAKFAALNPKLMKTDDDKTQTSSGKRS